MKPKDLGLVGLAYLLGVTVAYFCGLRASDDAAGLPQGIGTLLGLSAGVWSYHARHDQLAPARVKLAVGAIMALLTIVQGLVFQHLYKWMTYPDVGLGIGVAATLALPFLLWNAIAKNAIASRGGQVKSASKTINPNNKNAPPIPSPAGDDEK